ncbi:MAG: hypothetical protein LBK22_03510 [Tannerella sp.]|jgi:predicted Fe-Mo cluster-binding NifX family protein|nr:hypothetical protein [Tannerella sp.]
MTYRIAIASSNGETVDLHFGQATSLLIYETGEDGVRFVDDRTVELIPGEAAHTEENMQRFAEALSDCSAVFVRRIGARSADFLHRNGIRTFEVDFTLHHIFTTLVKNEQRGRVRVLRAVETGHALSLPRASAARGMDSPPVRNDRHFETINQLN